MPETPPPRRSGQGSGQEPQELSVKEARQRFRELLDRAAAGAETVILRRGRPVARIVPIEAPAGRGLPSLSQFRSELGLSGRPLSAEVVAARSEERY